MLSHVTANAIDRRNMDTNRSAAMTAALLGTWLLLAPAVWSDEPDPGFVRVTPEEVQWKPLPGFGGMQGAVVYGDPRKPGTYVIRVKFPPGVMTRPHFHPEDRHVLVLSGTWWAGSGESFDPDKAIPVKAGSYMKQPGGAYHFDGAKDEQVVLQIVGNGPSATTFAHPGDGPIGNSRPGR
jgi:quercetin dioxygenase-like cupin family protein